MQGVVRDQRQADVPCQAADHEPRGEVVFGRVGGSVWPVIAPGTALGIGHRPTRSSSASPSASPVAPRSASPSSVSAIQDPWKPDGTPRGAA